MDFLTKWNEKWRAHIRKNRIKTLYRCDQMQREFLDGASIIGLSDHKSYFKVTLTSRGERIIIKKSVLGFRLYDETPYDRNEFFDQLFKEFPFDEMFTEWSTLQKNS